MKFASPLLVACLALSLQGCVAPKKPLDGMTVVLMQTDANGKVVSSKVSQSSGDPAVDADAVIRAKAEIESMRHKFRNGRIFAPVKPRHETAQGTTSVSKRK